MNLSAAIPIASADATKFPFDPGRRVSLARVEPEPVQVILATHLIGEISEDLVLVEPLPIAIERDEDGAYVVADDLFLVYGSGKDQGGAVQDYVRSLIEYYEILEKGAEANEFDELELLRIRMYLRKRGIDALQAPGD